MTNMSVMIASFTVGLTTALILKNGLRTLFSVGLHTKSETLDKTKLAIVVRTDLKMGKGKCCSQCAHAAVSCYKKALKRDPRMLEMWENEGEPKVVLRPDTSGEDALIELVRHANSNKLVTSMIRDAGRTQIDSGTATAICIGPGNAATIDEIVGHLKLF